MKLFRKKKKSTPPLLFWVDVGCAVIRCKGKILISRRKIDSHQGGLWEFPGGKRLGGESLGTCLEREIWEELGIRIQTVRFLMRIDHAYPDKAVSLYFYECRLMAGTPQARGCLEWRWAAPFELKHYPFPPADVKILSYLTLLQ